MLGNHGGQLAEISEKLEVPEPVRSTQRLNLFPGERLTLGLLFAGMYGFLNGVVKGSRVSSLRFLAENAHRLPRTKGTWYFFHKRKNYVVLKDGLNRGIVTSLKFSAVTLGFLGTEAYLDQWRERIDLLSTVGASLVTGLSVSFYQRLGRRQVMRSTAGFLAFGAAVGGLDDLIRYAKRRASPSNPAAS